MAKACYDPREASQMWVRMSSSERGGGGGGSGPSSEEGEGGGWFSWLKALITQGSVSDVDFLSTHPANGKRVKVRLFFLFSFLNTPNVNEYSLTNEYLFLGYGGEVA